MDPVDREKVLQTLQANYDELSRQLEGISDEAAGQRPSEKEWSIKETLGHLLVCEEFAHTRLVRMAHETNPYLSAFDDHKLLEIRGYHATSSHEILSTFLAFGYENLKLLESLSADQWQRTGQHEERGLITIGYIADQMLSEHHREHLKQIQNLREWLSNR